MTIVEMKQKRKELVAKMDAIAKLDSPKPEDVTAFDGFKAEADGVVAQIQRAEYVEGQRT